MASIPSSFQSLSKMRPGPIFFASAWRSLFSDSTRSTFSEKRERERVSVSIWPLARSWSMRPTVAMTRWTDFLFSQRFSTIWRYW